MRDFISNLIYKVKLHTKLQGFCIFRSKNSVVFTLKVKKALLFSKRNKVIDCDGLQGNIIMDVNDSIKVILFKKQSFLKNLKS